MDACPPCPKCHERQAVRYTVNSDVGAYCRCDRCGNVWHHDFPQASPVHILNKSESD
jgi:uncharacterized Zn finger protein